MDSASFQFVAFGLSVALISNLQRSPAWRSWVLFFASVVFLFLTGNSLTVLVPVLAFLALGYASLAMIERGWPRAKLLVVLAVIFAHGWLKKYTFLPSSTLLQFPYVTLGLSYIFFRVLHLLIEAGSAGEHTHVSPFAYLLYTINFTTFVSGPIQRYDEFAGDQFAIEPIALGPAVIGRQLERIVCGFFKVNVLATLLHVLQKDAMEQLLQPVPITLKLFAGIRLIVLYPLFLYSNFSGYIDIVIALARLMRVRLPENFDRPFSASSFIDFWSRWHMTLSRWLKTYVYNPLLVALMRQFPSTGAEQYLGVFCFFVTFFLVGIWHGRTSEFVLFGVLQGGGVAINKLWQLALIRSGGRKGYKSLATNPIYTALGRGLTFSWFAFTTVWFWASWNEVDRIFKAISAVQWTGVWLAIWLSAALLLSAWEWLRVAILSIKSGNGVLVDSPSFRVAFASAVGLVAFVMTVLLSQPAPGIVYRAF